MRVAGVELANVSQLAGGDICDAWRGSMSGRIVFAKTIRAAPVGFFEAEARGLSLLDVEGGPPVAEVVAVAADGLVLEWIERGPPTRATAEDFGRQLAVMHAASLPAFGANVDGFIGSLPLPNASRASWPQFYVDQRILPYLKALSSDERGAVELVCEGIDEIAGAPEPPARIHGDLWSGNLVWTSNDVRLVDAASAHGGHRETDLAMLQLFGVPHFEAILTSYQGVSPLADGWRQRVSLHQLHPLLVHATLFGGGYGAQAAAAARAALAARPARVAPPARVIE
ncbi:MAG: fructosamine kinase family protein [Acidothermaceae bacterium]